MAGLVIEKQVGLELLEEGALGQPTQEEGFIDVDLPLHQGTDGPLVGWGAAGGDQGGADAPFGLWQLLQTMQGLQKRLERPVWQGLRGPRVFMGLKGPQAAAAVHPLGFIGEQHRVAIEGNAHLLRMFGRCRSRFGQHPRGRYPRGQG